MKLLNKSNIITLDNKTTQREIDTNGYMIVRRNPIAKAGVFDYLGAEIGDSNEEKIFKVFRPFEELEKVKDSFKGKPIILTHQWVEPDDMPTIRGSVTGEVVAEYPYLYADLTIYDGEAQDSIKNGSYQELSPAYLSDYVKQSGVTENGEKYDYIQKNIKFNHLALVDNGRTGKDLKVMDGISPKNNNIRGQKMDEKKENVKINDEDKRQLIDEITAIATKSATDFEGGEEEKAKTIIGLAEKLAYNPSEEEEKIKTDDDEEEIIEKEEEKEKATTPSKNTASEVKKAFNDFVVVFNAFLGEEMQEDIHNADSEEDKEEIIEAKTQDSIKKASRNILGRVSKSHQAYEEVKTVTGKFNIYTNDSIMSEQDIYRYALKCVGVDVRGVTDFKTAYKGYKQGVSRSNNEVKTIDSSNIRSEMSNILKQL